MEFARIARPGAVVALIWNERLILSDFEREYEELILQFAGDYNDDQSQKYYRCSDRGFLSSAVFCIAFIRE